MKKSMIKKKVEQAFSLAKELRGALNGADDFRLVSAILPCGGTVHFHYNFEKSYMDFTLVLAGKCGRIIMQPNEVVEKLTDILLSTDCIVEKYVWLGE